MTIGGDVFFFGLMLLALILMFNSNRGMVYGWSAFFLWFALGFWMFFSTSAPIALGETWADILVYVFFVLLPFGTLLQMMNTEIRHEKGGKSWKQWDSAPHEEDTPALELYRDKLYQRTRGTKRTRR